MSRPTHTCHRGIFLKSTRQQVNKSTSWLSDKSDKSDKSDRSDKSDEGGDSIIT